jgi:hypothetical protein
MFLRVLSPTVLASTAKSCQFNPFPVSFSVYSIYLWYDSMTPVLFPSKASSQHRFIQLEWSPVSLAEQDSLQRIIGPIKIVRNTLP